MRPASGADAPAPATASWAAYLGTRLTELALIVIGIGFAADTGQPEAEVRYLAVWDLLAVAYLVIGAVALRRTRRTGGIVPGTRAPTATIRVLASPRFNFVFTLAASVVGMTSAAVVSTDGHAPGVGGEIRLLGILSIGCAWGLLHAGYARFYGCLFYLPGEGGLPEGGLDFPGRDQPGGDDFMYFSFTIGTAFAVSDVNVTSSAVRWHVLVHSVLSFLYNAVVLALAFAVLTGR